MPDLKNEIVIGVYTKIKIQFLNAFCQTRIFWANILWDRVFCEFIFWESYFCEWNFVRKVYSEIVPYTISYHANDIPLELFRLVLNLS